MIVSFVIESRSYARFHCIKDFVYSDGHFGFCEYRHKLLTIRTVGDGTQSGSVAFYAAGIIGTESRLPSLVYRVYKILISQTIGILRGKLGIHDWDISFAQANAPSLQIVRKQLLAVDHF